VGGEKRRNTGGVTPAKLRALAAPTSRITNQVEFLRKIKSPLQEGAGRALKTNFLNEQKRLAELEQEMLRLVRGNPRDIAHVRGQVLRKLDEAYAIGEKFSGASTRLWREVYKDPVAREIIEQALEGKVVSFGGDPAWARKGLAPRLRDASGKRVALEIDHWPPKERNPFNSFRAENLEPVTRSTNLYRRNLARESAFGFDNSSGPSSLDEIEDFVQRNSLSRQQRPEGTTPKGQRGRNLKSFATPAPPLDDPATGAKGTEARATHDRLGGTRDPTAGRAPDPSRVASEADGLLRPSKLGRLGRAAAQALEVVTADPLDLALKPLKLSFISNVIIELTIGIMLHLLSRRLAAANAEGLGRAYANQVLKVIRDEGTGVTLEELVNATISRVQTDPGDFEGLDKKKLETSYVYADYEYDVLMELQANDPSDVLIFVLNNLKFAEVFLETKPVGAVRLVPRSAPLAQARTLEQDRTLFVEQNIVRYRYKHKMLLWDPMVYRHYIDLWNWYVKCKRELDDKLQRLTGEDKKLVQLHGTVALKMIEKFQFLDAVIYLDGEHRYTKGVGEMPERTQRYLFGVKQNAKAGDEVVKNSKKLQPDRRALLKMYVGHDVFKDQRRAISQREKLRKAKRSVDAPPPGYGRMVQF